jgi:hypothetical protein
MTQLPKAPNRAARRKRAKLYQSLGVLPLRYASHDPACAIVECVREAEEIRAALYPVLYDRTELSVMFALADALGRVVGMAAVDANHATKGIELAGGHLRSTALRVLREREESLP